MHAEAQAEANRRATASAEPRDVAAARTTLENFTRFTKEDYEVNWHHRVLCQYLDRFVAGDIKRLMVFMPPRHGKSELVSRRLPAFILGRNPDAKIIACSYGADLAGMLNRDVQRIVDDGRYAMLFPGTQLYGKNVRSTAQGTWLRNSDIFEVVGHTGYYRSAGVGGGITGMGFQYGIIDDPIKNREEADSKTFRDAVWEWYTSTFYTRQEKGAAILLTVTRWHEDDLAGRLLGLAQTDSRADQWAVIRFPAIAEGERETLEDERAEGEPLWASKYGRETLDQTRAAIGTRQWSALYQQRPRPREGDFFQRSWFTIVDAAPSDAARVRWWDKGATDGAGDYTVGVLMARKGGIYYVEDVVRGQWSAGARDAIIRQTAELDRSRGLTVHYWGEQEPGSGGKDAAAAFVKLLAGFAVSTEPTTRDKVVRAEPLASQSEAGNVRVVRGKWNGDWLEEMCNFPNGKHDDHPDATSGAFNKLSGVAGPLPSRQPEQQSKWTTAAGGDEAQRWNRYS